MRGSNAEAKLKEKENFLNEASCIIINLIERKQKLRLRQKRFEQGDIKP